MFQFDFLVNEREIFWCFSHLNMDQTFWEQNWSERATRKLNGSALLANTEPWKRTPPLRFCLGFLWNVFSGMEATKINFNHSSTDAHCSLKRRHFFERRDILGCEQQCGIEGISICSAVVSRQQLRLSVICCWRLQHWLEVCLWIV